MDHSARRSMKNAANCAMGGELQGAQKLPHVERILRPESFRFRPRLFEGLFHITTSVSLDWLHRASLEKQVFGLERCLYGSPSHHLPKMSMHEIMLVQGRSCSVCCTKPTACGGVRATRCGLQPFDTRFNRAPLEWFAKLSISKTLSALT